MAAKRERSNSLRESARGLPPQLIRHDSQFVNEAAESVIYDVVLDEESNEQITRLFKIIDTNSDGKLSIEDFERSEGAGPMTTKWQELRDKFDMDGDGLVTMQEFRRGFKKMVLRLSCKFESSEGPTTVGEYLQKIEALVNGQVQELCKQAFLWYVSM
ncbi:uncharacterized protein LOC134176991 [Corticium candelabrum]|uniref:uncharacterized protein LOC134176991 n=1 Tax=Corticium candelabrum TaxID=121492 RepID=UPI002E265622|nr:uncharacterized protein LOC134176991 [Corticium candelabrum]